MNRPVLLLYNIPEKSAKCSRIKLLASQLGFRLRPVRPEEYGIPLNELTAENRPAASPGAGTFSEEMLVFSGFTPEQLGLFLQRYRLARLVPVGLKAVLTGTNARWSSLRLREELRKEQASVRNAGDRG